jgi:peptidoglycan-N-acetylglucosamine deacetylase
MWKETRTAALARWPNGIRLPIVISPHHQSEEMSSLYPDGQPDGFDYSERQYGGRRGAWRLLEVMEKHGVQGTWLICGATAEKYPDVSRAVKKAGHAIAGHTYEHEMMCNLPAKQELELMKKTVAVFEDLLGERLRGWRTCFASHNTIDLVLREFDFEWDGSMWNDDLPSLLEGHGRKIVEIPFATYSDVALCSQRFPFNTYSTWNCATPEFFLRGLKSGFDALYERGVEETVMMPITVHDYITGRPSRAKSFSDFISYAKQFEGVVFTTHEQLSSWWSAGAVSSAGTGPAA